MLLAGVMGERLDPAVGRGGQPAAELAATDASGRRARRDDLATQCRRRVRRGDAHLRHGRGRAPRVASDAAAGTARTTIRQHRFPADALLSWSRAAGGGGNDTGRSGTPRTAGVDRRDRCADDVVGLQRRRRGQAATTTSTVVAPTTTTLPPRANDGVLKIGGFLPRTGPGAALGEPMIAAVDEAVADINQAGGVLGRNVGLEAVDENSGTGIDELLLEPVDAIVGPASSTVALSQLGEAVNAGHRCRDLLAVGDGTGARRLPRQQVVLPHGTERLVADGGDRASGRAHRRRDGRGRLSRRSVRTRAVDAFVDEVDDPQPARRPAARRVRRRPGRSSTTSPTHCSPVDRV